MSNENNMRLIKDLAPYRDEWRLTLKCLHSWKQNTPYAGDTLECVLIDQTGAKIQASTKRSQMARVQRYLPVGKWIVVDTVKVTAAGGQYRPTKQQYKINIIGDTKLTPSDYLDDNQSLDLAKYEEIFNGKCKPQFLIDVIGQIIDLGAVATVDVKGIDTKRVNFRLRDTSGLEVACCLWGKYAEQIETHMEEATPDEAIICLIRFAKIKEYRGEQQITNAFDASVVYLNPSMDEAEDFKQKLSLNDPLPLTIFDQSRDKKQVSKVSNDWDVVDVRCISEILQSIEAESSKIICSIESIDTDWGWFYFGCTRHNRRLTRTGRNSGSNAIKSTKPQFYCDICRGIPPKIEPKYKLHLIVKDDSETCSLMLLDSVANTIIGSEAVKLWDGSYDEIEDPEIIPQPIRDLVGKSFCFGVAITNDNVTNGSETFKVSQVWSGDYIQRIESLSEPVSEIETFSSTLSGGELPAIDRISENSSEDFATPSNKRKEDECDQMDVNSTSKKLCTKIIKKEKTKSQ